MACMQDERLGLVELDLSRMDPGGVMYSRTLYFGRIGGGGRERSFCWCASGAPRMSDILLAESKENYLSETQIGHSAGSGALT